MQLHSSVYREEQATKARVYLQTIEMVAQWLVKSGREDLVEDLLEEFTEDEGSKT